MKSIVAPLVVAFVVVWLPVSQASPTPSQVLMESSAVPERGVERSLGLPILKTSEQGSFTAIYELRGADPDLFHVSFLYPEVRGGEESNFEGSRWNDLRRASEPFHEVSSIHFELEENGSRLVIRVSASFFLEGKWTLDIVYGPGEFVDYVGGYDFMVIHDLTNVELRSLLFLPFIAPIILAVAVYSIKSRTRNRYSLPTEDGQSGRLESSHAIETEE